MAIEKKLETTKNLPYFKFYPTDFLLGIAYMSNAEVGAYIKLLCYQWNKGFLPNDMQILEKLSGGMTDNVLDKFTKTGKGWINERLEKERMAYLDKCEKNSKSINSRWNKNDTNVIRTYNERTTNVIPSQKSEVRSQNTENREQNLEVIEIINYLNSVCGTFYKYSSKKTKSLINARINEGFAINDFKIVIDKKFSEWNNTEYSKFLRPETLFSNKFEGYLNQQINKKQTKGEKNAEVSNDIIRSINEANEADGNFMLTI